MGGKLVPEGVVHSVWGFFILFLFAWAVGTIVLAAGGSDLETAASASIAVLGNVGPGLAAVGPTQNFAGFSPVEKLVIVDNSGLCEYEPKKPDWVVNMWVIRVPFGLGLVGAWNLIVKSTPYAPYWVLVNDDAWFEPDQMKHIPEQVDTAALNFLDILPSWSGVVFGEGMVDKVGLYDENF